MLCIRYGFVLVLGPMGWKIASAMTATASTLSPVPGIASRRTTPRPPTRSSNRCVWPADGDILVPDRTVCIIGTTDLKSDADNLPIPADQVQQMLRLRRAMIPGAARLARCTRGRVPLIKDVGDDTVTWRAA